MLEDFKQATRPDRHCMQMIESAEAKIGLFDGLKLVGFSCGKEYAGPNVPGYPEFGEKRILIIPALYVRAGYRQTGAGTRLIYRILAEAKKRGLEGVDLAGMLPATQHLFDKVKIRWLRNPKNPFSEVASYIGFDSPHTRGTIRFKRPLKKPLRPH